MSNLVVNNVPVDFLKLSDAMPCADTEMTKLIDPCGIWLQSQISKFQTHFKDKYLKYILWNCYQVNAPTPH